MVNDATRIGLVSVGISGEMNGGNDAGKKNFRLIKVKYK